MKKPVQRFPLKRLSFAVLASLVMQPAVAQQEDSPIEEVVTTGTRLKGTATAVLQERKQQAFVADILGAEQISRTGDSDAASALRRVTGLTLVDGKFIYVRGLGERYSSTLLNGATVPSPDPTRNVIPLDLFPSDIIESLSVQKSYSPSLPASFGGGNVDIRLKSIPTQFIFNVQGSLGYNSENTDDGFTYAAQNDNFLGRDDNLGAPASLQGRWADKSFLGLSDLNQADAVALFSDLERGYDPVAESIDPDMGFSVSLGNSKDLNDAWRVGFLVTTSYDRDTENFEEYELQLADRVNEEILLTRFFDDVRTTNHTTKWSSMINFGIDYNRNHRVDFSIVGLSDTSDEISERFGESENLNRFEGVRIRDISLEYEERTMYTNQVKGMHTFPELDFASFDWQYSLGRTVRNAPGQFEARFVIGDANEDDVFDVATESSLNNATTAGRYGFQILHDRVENYGWNFVYPVMLSDWEMEFKVGTYFISKVRLAENRRFDVNTRAFSDSDDLVGSSFADIFSDDVLADTSAFNTTPIIRNTTIGGDDYNAAQKVDAYYFEADLFYNSEWRFSGGARYEDFRQVVAPLDPATNQFDLGPDESRLQLAFQEDKLYPALALTYIMDDEMQFRVGVSETVVRPDLREVANATYIDPLTDFPIQGTPGLETTSVKNFDFRWEWYQGGGNNVSVGVFYKDMEAPIESVQSPSQDGPPLIRIANAEDGYLAGVELEFLQGLEFIGTGVWDNMFASGNVTVSDSEINLDRQAIVEQTGVSTAITNVTRRLTGHSEYVVNLQLGFDSDDGEHSASVVYNVFGERILIPGIDGFDDNFELPFNSLDVIYKYYPDFNSTLTFKVQNILAEEKEIEFEGVTRRSQTKGTGVSLTYKYEF